jgi:hypothetical protein
MLNMYSTLLHSSTHFQLSYSLIFLLHFIFCFFCVVDYLKLWGMFQLSQQPDGSLSSSMPTSVIQQGPSSLNTGASGSTQESSQPHSNGETSSDGGGRHSPTINIPPPPFSAKFGHSLAGTSSHDLKNSIATVMGRANDIY